MPAPAPTKKVRAHWFVAAVALRITNNSPGGDSYWREQWTTPGGQGTLFNYCGSWCRSTPYPLTDLAYTNDAANFTLKGGYGTVPAWRVHDMTKVVGYMRQGGLDGAYIEMVHLTSLNAPGMLSGGDDWNRAVWAMEGIDAYNVANGTSFDFVPQPDMSGGANATQAQIVNALLTAYTYSSFAKVVEGGVTKMLVSPYAPESQANGVAFWQGVMDTMAGQGKPIAVVPCFGNYGANWNAWKGISYGFSHWGSRSPAGNASGVDSSHAGVTRAANAHALGKIWVQPVSLQDERPRSRVYDEAVGWGNLDASANLAIADGGNNAADEWLIPTWDDETEGSGIFPSTGRGFSALELVRRYTVKYKTGSFPANDDAVFLAHRRHPLSAQPSYSGYGTPPTANMMTLRSGSTAGTDAIDLVTFFKASTSVTFTIGSRTKTVTIPAGFNRHTETWSAADIPSGTGTISVNASRNGSTTPALFIPDRTLGNENTPLTLTTTPVVQDLQYYANHAVATLPTSTTQPPAAGAWTIPFQMRRDTAAAWTTANPVLKAGQEGWETDTGRRKVGDGTSAWSALAYVDDAALMYALLGGIAVGEATILPRERATSSGVTMTSGTIVFSAFTAWKTETANNVKVYSGGTAGSGLTLARVGIYSVASDGAVTLLTSTASDTTLFAASSTAYTRALGAPFAKKRGQRYALGLLITGTTMPTIPGVQWGIGSATTPLPWTGAQLTGQTDLPASATAAALTAAGSNNRQLLAEILP